MEACIRLLDPFMVAYGPHLTPRITIGADFLTNIRNTTQDSVMIDVDRLKALIAGGDPEAAYALLREARRTQNGELEGEVWALALEWRGRWKGVLDAIHPTEVQVHGPEVEEDRWSIRCRNAHGSVVVSEEGPWIDMNRVLWEFIAANQSPTSLDGPASAKLYLGNPDEVVPSVRWMNHTADYVYRRPKGGAWIATPVEKWAETHGLEWPPNSGEAEPQEEQGNVWWHLFELGVGQRGIGETIIATEDGARSTFIERARSARNSDNPARHIELFSPDGRVTLIWDNRTATQMEQIEYCGHCDGAGRIQGTGCGVCDGRGRHSWHVLLQDTDEIPF